ncbi:hypothetical protein [Synechococcus sp. PCC 7502]|uniref:hypothetical protein n=1 Tax=Synechococcus sp. PCC 7502 TaxID=1173263 RepID=UPI001181C552|nr:hypothetical protein [Synechococcus sp. PCC 7502]
MKIFCIPLCGVHLYVGVCSASPVYIDSLRSICLMCSAVVRSMSVCCGGQALGGSQLGCPCGSPVGGGAV